MAHWETKLDFNSVWHDEPEDEFQHELSKWTDPMMFAKRDAIVAIMKTLPQYTEDQDADNFDDEIWWIVDEMSDVDNTDWFNMVWSGFYDWCDANSVWVDIHKRPAEPKTYEVDGFIMGVASA